MCRVPERRAADFPLSPSTSTVWEWHRFHTDAIELSPEYEPWVTARFSGGRCLDAGYAGPLWLMLSTDPLNDVTVADTFETTEEGANRPMRTQVWSERQLAALPRIGLPPPVVIRDGAVVDDAG